MGKEHNIMTEWADVFECSCGFAYEGENRVEVERAHLYVNKFVDDCNEAELREQIAQEIVDNFLKALTIDENDCSCGPTLDPCYFCGAKDYTYIAAKIARGK